MIHGGDGSDTLLGGWGADTLSGGLGSDIIDGGVNADTIYGGGVNLVSNGTFASGVTGWTLTNQR